jgi:hypothetical protein
MSRYSFKLSPDRELDQIVSLQQAEKPSSLSVDSLRRNHSDKIIKLGPRRDGMRVRDALMLNEPNKSAT